MPSAQSAIELAAWQTLDAGVTGATVYQHVPDEASSWPIVIIGDLETYPLDSKGASGDRGGTLTINAVDQAEERIRLIDTLAAIEALLGGQAIEADGFRVSFNVEGSSAVRDESGNYYVGSVRMAVFAIAIS